MKRLLIILTIAFSSVLHGWAQSSLDIDLNELETEISSTLSIDLSESLIAINSQSIAEIESNTDYSYSTKETNQDDDVFNKLSNIKGVDVVYISKAMLGMMPAMNMPGVNIGNVAGKLKSLEIYSAETVPATKSLLSLSKSLLNSGNYETLMLVKDGDSKTAFYMKKAKSNNVSEMLMITEEAKEATIIRFLGDFSIQDIKNITNQDKQNKSTPNNTSNGLERAKAAERRAKAAEERAKRAEERARRAEERAKRAK